MMNGTACGGSLAQTDSPRGPRTTGFKVRLRADQSRAISGLLNWALDADERRHDDQEWTISGAVENVLGLEDVPSSDQYGSAVAIIGMLADRFATPTRAAVALSEDEHLLLAAVLDQAFYQHERYDNQQWSIEAAAAALYPNLDDAPSAHQYDTALAALRAARARLDPLPERTPIRVGDALLAWDLDQLDDNDHGYEIVAVSDDTVDVRDEEGIDHSISRAAIDARRAGIERFFGDFETVPTPYQPSQEDLQRWAERARLDRAKNFVRMHNWPLEKVQQLDFAIAACEGMIDGFVDGSIRTGSVERSVSKQRWTIKALQAERAETLQLVETKRAELEQSDDPRATILLAWQAQRADATVAFERTAAFAQLATLS